MHQYQQCVSKKLIVISLPLARDGKKFKTEAHETDRRKIDVKLFIVGSSKWNKPKIYFPMVNVAGFYDCVIVRKTFSIRVVYLTQ